jgi:hypothetical protein
MQLELNEEEVNLLERIFKHYLPELRDEIFHTDAYAFREELKEDEVVLKRLMERLAALRAGHEASR